MLQEREAKPVNSISKIWLRLHKQEHFKNIKNISEEITSVCREVKKWVEKA